jgi:hypothetical protein
MMDTNVRSTFLFTRHAVPMMLAQRSGTILMISSMEGIYGFGGEAVYCMTKFAQVGFAQALDKELRQSGIKVGPSAQEASRPSLLWEKDGPNKALHNRRCSMPKMSPRQCFWPVFNRLSPALLRFRCAQWPNP